MRIVPRASVRGDVQLLASVLPMAAEIDYARGELASALELICSFGEMANGAAGWYWPPYLADVTRVAIAAGAPELAARLLERPRSPAIRHELSALTARAALAEAGADPRQRYPAAH